MYDYYINEKIISIDTNDQKYSSIETIIYIDDNYIVTEASCLDSYWCYGRNNNKLLYHVFDRISIKGLLANNKQDNTIELKYILNGLYIYKNKFSHNLYESGISYKIRKLSLKEKIVLCLN